MSNSHTSIHGEWSSRWAFILAASGAAIGLGNIWKFPYITGINGGGAFVIIYLACVIMIGVPLMMTEVMVGRRAKCNPATALAELATESGRSPHWRWVGLMAILAGFLILSYYTVIAGWALDYVFMSAANRFHMTSANEVSALFDALINNPSQLALWHTLITATTCIIVARGVQQGLEKFTYIMFPTILSLLFILLIYAINTGHFSQGLAFLFTPDFSKLSIGGIIAALGHAFFTLSLACGTIMMYGAYLPSTASITVAAVAIAGTDTLVALLAGMIIFPIVFANGLEPGSGPGLLFKTLPIAFGSMPYGQVFATLFFIMLVFAALTSAISLIEPSVAWLMETRGYSRIKATSIAGLGVWLLGFGTIFSFNIWDNILIFGLNIFDLLDYITANLMLPIGGALVAIFAGWRMQFEPVEGELKLNSPFLLQLWYFCIRYIAPLAILIVMLSFFGVITA